MSFMFLLLLCRWAVFTSQQINSLITVWILRISDVSPVRYELREESPAGESLPRSPCFLSQSGAGVWGQFSSFNILYPVTDKMIYNVYIQCVCLCVCTFSKYLLIDQWGHFLFRWWICVGGFEVSHLETTRPVRSSCRRSRTVRGFQLVQLSSWVSHQIISKVSVAQGGSVYFNLIYVFCTHLLQLLQQQEILKTSFFKAALGKD